MNNYYHAFDISFNYWFIILPVMAIIMIIFGASNSRWNKNTKKVMRRDKSNFITSILAIGMDIILLAAILTESSAGILQTIDNSLSVDDNPVWSLVLFVVVMVGVAFLIYYVLFGASIFGRQVKATILKEMHR